MCFGLSEMKVLRLWYVHTRVNSGLLKFSWKQQSSQKKNFLIWVLRGVCSWSAISENSCLNILQSAHQLNLYLSRYYTDKKAS